ncbi:DUF551 domain-containing protein [Enterobacter hormaechei]|nr:DUF551 domain-containing protein [Enterobacter hormaechei]
MSNIDKHAVQTVADLKAGYTLGHADVAILNELARIALASLEAEPAIHRWRRVTFEPYGPYPWHYGNFIGFSKPVDGIEDEYYYAAPPAPVSVPAAMEMDDDFDSAFEHGKAVGWNAYRAAMLQSFGNSEQLNSPVIPDGWVACSERMPEKADEVLCAKEFDGPGDWRQKVGYYLAGKWTVYSASWTPTHWMPLPSAPQQEA